MATMTLRTHPKMVRLCHSQRRSGAWHAEFVEPVVLKGAVLMHP